MLQSLDGQQDFSDFNPFDYSDGGKQEKVQERVDTIWEYWGSGRLYSVVTSRCTALMGGGAHVLSRASFAFSMLIDIVQSFAPLHTKPKKLIRMCVFGG